MEITVGCIIVWLEQLTVVACSTRWSFYIERSIWTSAGAMATLFYVITCHRLIPNVTLLAGHTCFCKLLSCFPSPRESNWWLSYSPVWYPNHHNKSKDFLILFLYFCFREWKRVSSGNCVVRHHSWYFQCWSVRSANSVFSAALPSNIPFRFLLSLFLKFANIFFMLVTDGSYFPGLTNRNEIILSCSFSLLLPIHSRVLFRIRIRNIYSVIFQTQETSAKTISGRCRRCHLEK